MTKLTEASKLIMILLLSARALKMWGSRQWAVAAVMSVSYALVVAVVTALIPNPWFARDIEPVWWNYPVLIVTSVGVGLLTATYVRSAGPGTTSDDDRRTSRWGIAGAFLTWFAVGCPVCNKIALLVLGYSGAITWFAPLQPFLAVAAALLLIVALVWRLRGQVACPMPNTVGDTGSGNPALTGKKE